MKVKFDETRMLEAWRRRQGILPLRDDMSVVRTDGLDFSDRLRAEMDAWYVRLLEKAPVDFLAPEDCSDLPVTQAGGALCVSVPEGTVRVVAAKLSGWGCSARVVGEGTPAARMQAHPFTRACREAPVAVFDRATGVLKLFPAAPGDTLQRLDLVVRRQGEYAFDRAALDFLEF